MRSYPEAWCLRPSAGFPIPSLIFSSSRVVALFMLCCVCGRAEALAAVQGAVRLAQDANDHVCLQHCLVSSLNFVIFLIESPEKDGAGLEIRFC